MTSSQASSHANPLTLAAAYSEWPQPEQRPRRWLAATAAIAVWLLLDLLLVAAVAWASVAVQSESFVPKFFYPLIYPLLVGAALGAGQAGLLRLTGAPAQRWMLAAALVLGLLAVLGQDYVDFVHYQRQFAAHAERHPLVALAPEAVRPSGFGKFLASGWHSRLLERSLDAVLTAAASVAVVALLQRRMAPLRGTAAPHEST